MMSGIDDFDGIDDAEIRRQRAIARDLRKTRWWQQKTASGQCYYCGKKTAYKNITMDHVLPLTRGGKSTKDNLVPSCKKCNTAKKSMMPLQWQEYLENLK
ncbi:MAG: HNH endonuclease [Desulfocapsaceae bacterium]|nr:HNH endonuclease [Desulfocapsaceae bacterium]